MPAEDYYNVSHSVTKPSLSYSDHLVNNNDVYPSAKLLSSVKEQVGGHVIVVANQKNRFVVM